MADTATQIMQAADKLHRISDKNFKQWMEDLQQCWEGESAELLLEKCRKLADRMSATEREMRRIGEEVIRKG